jgi:hypothetical protein
MSLGSWNPADGSETLLYTLDTALLAECAAFAAKEHWTALPDWVQQHLPANASQMMKLDATTWHSAVSAFDEPSLHALIRFFTVAEQQLSHWHGGDKSPVIWLSRELKRRGTPLPRELVLWIKGNSDNRFLPHGPIL